MAMTVLITGGSGTIGRVLSARLTELGYNVRWLSRNPTNKNKYPTYKWDIESDYVDSTALTGVNVIIHLAGAGIADKRWSEEYKKTIIDSRVKSAEILHQALNESNHRLEAFISASGTGYYGAFTNDKIYREKDDPGKDFIGHVTKVWEDAAFSYRTVSDRVVALRTPMVIAKDEGALKKMAPLFKRGLGAAVGSGRQIMPWVYINDIVNAYLFAISTSDLDGSFNVAADEMPTNKSFSKSLANAYGKKLWLPNVPSFVLKLIYGEMANLLLNGSRVDNSKLKNCGFEYQTHKLQSSLDRVVA